MGIHPVSVDDETWRKAMEAVGRGNLSGEVERFLEELAGVGSERSDTRPTLLEESGLTTKQAAVVKQLIRDQREEIGLQAFMQLVRSHGIYTRRDFIEKAWHRIHHDDYAPYQEDGSVLVAREIECYCDSAVYAHVLPEHDGRCPQCGTTVVQLDTAETGLHVR